MLHYLFFYLYFSGCTIKTYTLQFCKIPMPMQAIILGFFHPWYRNSNTVLYFIRSSQCMGKDDHCLSLIKISLCAWHDKDCPLVNV